MDPPYPIIKPAPRTGQSKLIVADMPAIDHHWAEPAPAVYPAQSKQPAGDGGWHWTMEEATSWAGTHGHIETLKMLAVDWERQVRALSTLVHARQPQLPSRERLRSIQRSPPRDTRPGSCRKRLPGATLRPLHEYPPLRAAFPSPEPTVTSSTGSSHASDHFPRTLLQPIVLRNHPVSSGYSSYPRLIIPQNRFRRFDIAILTTPHGFRMVPGAQLGTRYARDHLHALARGLGVSLT